MVFFDVDHSPSLRRHDAHYRGQDETIDVTRTTTPTTPTTTARNADSISGTDPTAVTRTTTTTTTTTRNGGAAPSSSSSPSSSRMSPTISNHHSCLKSGNASPTASSIATSTSSYSSLSSMEIEDDANNNNNNFALVNVQQQQQPLHQQQLQGRTAAHHAHYSHAHQAPARHHHQQHYLFPKRRVSFASTNVVTVIDDDPVLFTDYEKSICFCSRKDRALFEQDRISVYSAYDRHMKYGLVWKETDQITLRGLEDFFGMRSKEEIRHEHVVKVLKEQTRQRLFLQQITVGAAELDVDTLRYVSSESSAEGRHRAAEVGRDDAIVAQRCYFDTSDHETTKTSSSNTTRNTNSNKNMTTAHHPSCHVTSCLASWEQQWFY